MTLPAIILLMFNGVLKQYHGTLEPLPAFHQLPTATHITNYVKYEINYFYSTINAQIQEAELSFIGRGNGCRGTELAEIGPGIKSRIYAKKMEVSVMENKKMKI